MEREITKAVIPAAGLGTRMLPVTKVMPKELIPVGGKPMIQYAVEESIASGIKDIAIIINKEKELIRNYFESPVKKNLSSHFAMRPLSRITSSCRLCFIYREGYKGLADAIVSAQKFTRYDPFALILPDNMFFSSIPAIKQIIEGFYEEGTYTVGLLKITKDEAKNFSNVGRIKYKKIKERLYRITYLFPKKEGTFSTGGKRWAVKTIARHILLPDFFDYVKWLKGRTKGEIDDIPIYQKLVKEGRFVGRLLEVKGFDVGNYGGLNAAIQFLHRKQTIDHRLI